jgi:hypothetical protein
MYTEFVHDGFMGAVKVLLLFLPVFGGWNLFIRFTRPVPESVEKSDV